MRGLVGRVGEPVGTVWGVFVSKWCFPLLEVSVAGA